MARYATNEKMWKCWGCGISVPARSMYTKEEYPQTYRCPRCDENILYINNDGGVTRAGVYYGPLRYADYNHFVFADGAHVPVLDNG